MKRAPESVAARLRDIPGVAQVDTRIARYVTIDIEGVKEPLRGLALSLPRRNETALNALVLQRRALSRSRSCQRGRGPRSLRHRQRFRCPARRSPPS